MSLVVRFSPSTEKVLGYLMPVEEAKLLEQIATDTDLSFSGVTITVRLLDTVGVVERNHPNLQPLSVVVSPEVAR